MSKVILFDFDGTIADTFEDFLVIVEELSLLYKLPLISRDELEKLRLQDARTLIKKLQIPFYKIPFIARDMKRKQQENILTMKPFKDLPEVLKVLKSNGYHLGILTSNGEKNVTTFLRNNNLEIFDFLYSDASMFGKDKVIRKFLKQHNVSKEDVIYVGDEIRDINACKKAGVRIAAVTWGFNSKEGLAQHTPDFLLDKPSDLLHVVGIN